MTSVDRLHIGNRLDLERTIRELRKADLSVQDLSSLAEGHDSEGRDEKQFDWSFERRKVVVEATLAFVASLPITWCIPYFKMDLTSQLFVPIVTVSVSALFFRARWRLRSLKQECLAAL
jgi:hypothetical protein